MPGRTLLATALLFASFGSASAQTASGFYLRQDIGLGMAPSVEACRTQPRVTSSGWTSDCPSMA